MLQRVSGTLFVIFGSFWILGYLSGDDAPRVGESGFSSGQYGRLISGIALLVGGLYLLLSKRPSKSS